MPFGKRSFWKLKLKIQTDGVIQDINLFTWTAPLVRDHAHGRYRVALAPQRRHAEREPREFVHRALVLHVLRPRERDRRVARRREVGAPGHHPTDEYHHWPTEEDDLELLHLHGKEVVVAEDQLLPAV